MPFIVAIDNTKRQELTPVDQSQKPLCWGFHNNYFSSLSPVAFHDEMTCLVLIYMDLIEKEKTSQRKVPKKQLPL